MRVQWHALLLRLLPLLPALLMLLLLMLLLLLARVLATAAADTGCGVST
jgi:hypothetical protein